MMKRLTAVLLTAALCAGTAACGSGAQSTARDASSKTASAGASGVSDSTGSGEASRAESSVADSSAADVSKAESSGADSSGADVSKAESSGADSSAADKSGVDSSAADKSGVDSSAADSSGADAALDDESEPASEPGSSKEEKPVGGKEEKKSKVFDKDYEIVSWEYEEYVPTLLSTLEEGKVYEAADCGDMTFVNDTEKDLLVYYESDDGVIGVLPHAAETIYGLAIEDPVAYIDEGDVVRVRVEEVDPRTLDRDTEGVLFVDRTKPGKKLRITGKYMLVNGGDQDVSIAYTTMEGEKTTVVMNPGCVLGFEWLSAEGGMRVV